MKKVLSLLAGSASIFIIAACSESEGNDVVDNQPTLKYFSVASSPSSTRTVVDGLDSKKPGVAWQNTDKLFVWGDGNTESHLFVFDKYYDEDYDNYAFFKGTIGSFSKYYIMYPNQEGATFDGNGIITATIPAYQKAMPNSFDPAASICTGATKGQDDTSVTIEHVCAYLKITTTKPCYSVTVTGATNKDFSVTGQVTVDSKSGGAPITGFPGGVPFVTLNATGTADCSTTFPAGTYLMAIAPSTGYPGFTVKVDYAVGEDAEVTREAARDFDAGVIYNLGTAHTSDDKVTSFMIASSSASDETTPNNAPTRTMVDGLDTKKPGVAWETTDKIFVWGNGNTQSHLFAFKQFYDEDYDNYAFFTGEIGIFDKYYIMYPNQEGATFDGNGIITATIPAYQKAVSNSFDPAASICTGATKGQEDTSVTIEHVCAYLKITTTQPCYSVTVTGATNKEFSITGKVNVDSKSGGAPITGFPGGVPFVTLNATGTEDCSTTFPAGTYLMAIAPSTGYPGFSVKVDYEGDNDPEVTKEEARDFDAGVIYNLGVAEVKTGE